MPDKFLISVVGPTAIGKTKCSIELAKFFKTEIVSTDSRQFYKEMEIGTAVPSPTELASIPHHFIHNISIHEPYTVGTFESEAVVLLEELFEKYEQVILVGGSGLFHKAIVDGLDDFPALNPDIRKALNKQLAEDGITSLQRQLKDLDFKSFETIDINNPQRLMRALEVTIGTGTPFSHFKTQKRKDRDFKIINVGLTAHREIIYERINQRVDQMIQEGLVNEARELYPYKDLNALNTVGYKELFEHFDGQYTLEEATERIKMHTRRFAKRQLTWFRKDNSIKWFDYQTPIDTIITYAQEQIKKSS
jgi:tRNA dimethylallyltransferase